MEEITTSQQVSSPTATLVPVKQEEMESTSPYTDTYSVMNTCTTNIMNTKMEAEAMDVDEGGDVLENPVMKKQPPSTFRRLQETYRGYVEKTFSDYDKYTRLERIFNQGPDIYNVIFFFVTEYGKNILIATESGRHYIVTDEYKNAISTHQKRFYDFKSCEGKGKLIWDGVPNPLVLANEAFGSVALPLPCLVAVAWFILFEFDKEFWKKEMEIRDAYAKFTEEIRSQYTMKHRATKLQRRREAEEIVLSNRTSKKPHKKGVVFTREERAQIAELIKQANSKRKENNESNHTAVKNSIRKKLLGKVSTVLLQSNTHSKEETTTM